MSEIIGLTDVGKCIFTIYIMCLMMLSYLVLKYKDINSQEWERNDVLATTIWVIFINIFILLIILFCSDVWGINNIINIQIVQFNINAIYKGIGLGYQTASVLMFAHEIIVKTTYENYKKANCDEEKTSKNSYLIKIYDQYMATAYFILGSTYLLYFSDGYSIADIKGIEKSSVYITMVTSVIILIFLRKTNDLIREKILQYVKDKEFNKIRIWREFRVGGIFLFIISFICSIYICQKDTEWFIKLICNNWLIVIVAFTLYLMFSFFVHSWCYKYVINKKYSTKYQIRKEKSKYSFYEKLTIDFYFSKLFKDKLGNHNILKGDYIKLINTTDLYISIVIMSSILAIIDFGLKHEIIVFLLAFRCIFRSIEVIIAFGGDLFQKKDKNTNLSNLDRVKLTIKSFIEVFIMYAAYYYVEFSIFGESYLNVNGVWGALKLSFGNSFLCGFNFDTITSMNMLQFITCVVLIWIAFANYNKSDDNTSTTNKSYEDTYGF